MVICCTVLSGLSVNGIYKDVSKAPHANLVLRHLECQRLYCFSYSMRQTRNGFVILHVTLQSEMHGLANVAFVLSFDSITPILYIQDLQAAQPVDGCLTRCWDSSCCSFMHLSIQDLIYQTRERVFHQDIQSWGSGLKNKVQLRVFNQLQGVWIPDETIFGFSNHSL